MNVFERLTLDSVKSRAPRGVVVPRPVNGLETMRRTAPLPLIPVLSARSGSRVAPRLSAAVTDLDTPEIHDPGRRDLLLRLVFLVRHSAAKWPDFVNISNSNEFEFRKGGVGMKRDGSSGIASGLT